HHGTIGDLASVATAAQDVDGLAGAAHILLDHNGTSSDLKKFYDDLKAVRYLYERSSILFSKAVALTSGGVVPKFRVETYDKGDHFYHVPVGTVWLNDVEIYGELHHQTPVDIWMPGRDLVRLVQADVSMTPAEIERFISEYRQRGTRIATMLQ